MPDKKVAHLNIAHFRKLLATELDEGKRKTILRLLAEEEAKGLNTAKSGQKGQSLGRLPLPPVSRLYVNPSLGFHIDPTAKNAAAWKHQRIRTLVVEDRQLNITVKGCAADILPHELS
jgi:hypothetical protein